MHLQLTVAVTGEDLLTFGSAQSTVVLNRQICCAPPTFAHAPELLVPPAAVIGLEQEQVVEVDESLRWCNV